MAGLANQDIDIATRGAEQFINVYYEIYDSKERNQRLPNFYRQSSTVVWNGNPKQGADGMKELLENMPASKHEVQSFDCHPIPNTSPPTLLVTVSGTVVHGKVATMSHLPVGKMTVDNQPRIFAQSFMLAPDSDTTAPGDSSKPNVKYYVLTDDLRFVG